MPRYLRREVPGRLTHDGRERAPLDLSGLPAILDDFRADGVEAVAICLLHSYADPSHEQAVLAACARALAGGLGRRVAPDHARVARVRAHEHGRALGVRAAGRRALSDAASRTASTTGGFDGQLYIMQSNCGVDSVETTKQIPITMVESGPASGFWGAAELGRLIGEPNVLALDIGGTTAKCSLIEGGHVKIMSDYWIGRTRRSAGYPIKVPVVDLVEIGNGGGSIAWVDDFGKLHVGPQSAGAVPGPAPTAAAGPRRRRPTPTSRSAGSTPTTSAAARSTQTWPPSTARSARSRSGSASNRRSRARHRPDREQQHDQRAQAGLGEPRLRPA